MGLRALWGQETWVWVLRAAVHALTLWPSRSARQKEGQGRQGRQLLPDAPAEVRRGVSGAPGSVFSRLPWSARIRSETIPTRGLVLGPL